MATLTDNFLITKAFLSQPTEPITLMWTGVTAKSVAVRFFLPMRNVYGITENTCTVV